MILRFFQDHPTKLIGNYSYDPWDPRPLNEDQDDHQAYSPAKYL